MAMDGWGIRRPAMEPDVADNGVTRLPITPAFVASGSAKSRGSTVGMLSERSSWRLPAVPSISDVIW